MLEFLAKHTSDFIYICMLMFSIFIGQYYRRFKIIEEKKVVGTLLGIFMIITVCSYNALHPILSGIFGIMAIKTSSIKKCHVTTFFFMFGYLAIFRLGENFGAKPSSGHTNMIEMIIVLRVVGLAFEINGSYLAVVEKKKDERREDNEKDRDDDYVELINPDHVSMFHYVFNYIGLLTGPYYRYRTFNDYFNLPFSRKVDYNSFVVHNLRNVPMYVSLYLGISYLWPLEYVLTEDHNSRHFIYRMIYPWLLFTAFRQRIYAGMTLAESVCMAAGMGAYPVEGRNRSGHGPTVGYLKLKQMSSEVAAHRHYDFKTIESMDIFGCETVVSLRDSMKVWNKTVQYWVATVVYKRFPYKNFKIHATLFVSVIWHGFHPGYFFCIFFCPFYVLAEDLYYNLYYREATGMKKTIIGFIMWFLRTHSESFQATAFLLLSFDRLWTYYTSVYHYWYFVWFAFFVLGLILNRVRMMLRPLDT